MPARMKITITPTLIHTMMLLAAADSLMPMYRIQPSASTISTAGRLMIEPVVTRKLSAPLSSGALVSAAGIWMPHSASRLTTYCDHPTATADADIRYSSDRFQPMIQATDSPSVQYEYVYALPDTGIIAANSE